MEEEIRYGTIETEEVTNASIENVEVAIHLVTSASVENTISRKITTRESIVAIIPMENIGRKETVMDNNKGKQKRARARENGRGYCTQYIKEGQLNDMNQSWVSQVL